MKTILFSANNVTRIMSNLKTKDSLNIILELFIAVFVIVFYLFINVRFQFSNILPRAN